MKTFSTSDLVRAVGDVTHAASSEPVLITHHAKPRYVLMSVAAFEKLGATAIDPRQAYGVGEAPAALAEPLLDAVDGLIAKLETSVGD